MRILVIDDTELHLQAARETLADHEVVCVNNYDEAVRHLGQGFEVVLCDLLMPAGKESQGSTGKAFVGQMMPVGFALALRAVLNGAKYVAVVTATNHHNHPASAMLDRLGREYWGFHLGSSPESAARSIGGNFPKFVVNGARVGFYHHPAYLVKSAPCPSCKGTGRRFDSYHNKEVDCEPLGDESKHWGMVLQALLQDPPSEK